MDFFKKIEFEIDNIKDLCESLNIDKYTYSYVEKIQQEISFKHSDTESYVYCLKKIDSWIEENKYSISSTSFEYTKLKEIIESLIMASSGTKIIEAPFDMDDLENQISNYSTVDIPKPITKNILFLSHSSTDKQYADAIRDFLSGIGVKDDCLIYTSHPNHKIPLDKSIFNYLRKFINQNVYMIILWSDSYLDSPACMNELGALWVVGGNYTNVFVPGFDFNNPKFKQCAIDTNKMGIYLKKDSVCKTRLIELKNNVSKLFNLRVSEEKTTFLIDEFMKKI